MSYTEEDVQRLVRVAKEINDFIALHGKMQVGHWGPPGSELHRAIKPFQPDPDEALIEQMAQEYINSVYIKYPETTTDWKNKEDHTKEIIRHGMKYALRTAKEAGYAKK